MSACCSVRLVAVFAVLVHVQHCVKGLDVATREAADLGGARRASFRAELGYPQGGDVAFFEAPQQNVGYASFQQQGLLPYDARGYAAPQEQFLSPVAEGTGPVPGFAADYSTGAAMPYAVPVALSPQQGQPQLMSGQWPQVSQQQEQQWLLEQQRALPQQPAAPVQEQATNFRVQAPSLMSVPLPMSAVSLLNSGGHLSLGLQNSSKFNATKFFEKLANKTQVSPAESIATSAIWLLFMTIIAFFYFDHKPHPPVQQHDRAYGVTMGQWRFGLFHCCDQPMLCLFACCCGAIRWGDTQRMGNYMGYWQAFFMYAVLQQLCPLPYVGEVAAFLWIILVVYQRQKIRKRFQIPYFDCHNCTGSCSTVPLDCCTYCFCTVCAIVQEARQFEEFYQQDPLYAQTAGIGHDVDYPPQPGYPVHGPDGVPAPWPNGGVGWQGNPQAGAGGQGGGPNNFQPNTAGATHGPDGVAIKPASTMAPTNTMPYSPQANPYATK